MQRTTATIASFIPREVLRDLPAEVGALAPRERALEAVVMFTDIARFSALSRTLVQSGAEGVERLSQVLNLYLGRQVELIERAGGDIVKFAGDAILALWTVESAADRDDVLARACHCALELQRVIRQVAASEDDVQRLEIRVSIGAGEIRGAHLGGHYGRWLLLVSGPGVLQALDADRHTEPGSIVLPDALLARLAGAAAEPVAPGFSRLHGLRGAPPPPGRLAPLPALDDAVLRAYLPSSILARLHADQDEWLAELRQVTVVFIKLGGLDQEHTLERAQQVILAVQREIYRHEGSVNKLNVDDKGVTVVAAFGLPPLSHEDDASRAVHAALALHHHLRGLGVQVDIGVASGRTFCGTVGDERRREYTLIGATVNLAARLMQDAHGEILCDEPTARGAHAHVRFQTLPPRQLKGWSSIVPVFAPQGPRQAAPPVRPARAMVGRRGELGRLCGLLDQLADSGTGGRVLIQGDAGMGKSVLVDALLSEARRRGLRVLVGECDTVEQTTAYYPWRGVFAQLLGDDPAAALARLRALAEAPEMARLLPLYSAVGPLGLAETDVTVAMTGKLRLDNTNELLSGVLARAARGQPTLIVLDDVQWMDTASWALTVMAQARLEGVVLVLVGRPQDRAWVEEFRRGEGSRNNLTLFLGSLAEDEVAALASQCLGVARLSRELLAVLLERAGGNPFFTEQLAGAMRDTGMLELVGDEARMRVTPDSSATAMLLPDTLQGVITARLDRLPPAQVLTLKVASVIGRLFRFSILRDIHPVERDTGALRANLAALAELDITPQVASEPELEYIFKHIVTHEVTYNLMLYAQRRELHRAVAEWIERHHHADLGPYLLLLAHHWGHAGRTARAIELMLQAAAALHRLYAGRDLLALIQRIHDLAAQQSHVLAEDATLQLDDYRGQAYVAVGEHEKARVEICGLLDRLGLPVPGSAAGLGLGLGGKMLMQSLGRRLPAVFARRSKLPQTHARIIMTALNHLVGIGLMSSDQLLLGYATMQVISLGEGWGPPEEAATAHAFAAVMYGMMGDPAVGRGYRDRALKLVEGQRSAARCMTLVITAISHLNNGDFAELDATLEQALELSTYLGDRHSTAFALVYRAEAHMLRGRMTAAATDFRASAHQFDQMGNRLSQRTVLAQLARIDLNHGRLTAAIADLQLLLDTMLDKKEHHAATLPLIGPLIEAHLLLGNLEAALVVEQRVAATIAPLTPSTHGFYRVYAALVEMWLALAAQEPARRKAARAGVDAALKKLRKTAAMFPVARPALLRVEGQVAIAAGETARAAKLWEQALVAAQALANRKEQALVHALRGRHGAAPAPGDELLAARTLFDQLHMPVHLARCEAR